MNYEHAEMDMGPHDIVEVDLDREANVRLLDDNNYYYYQNELKYNSHGGLAKSFPVHISPPTEGHWHLVIDSGKDLSGFKSKVKMVGKNQYTNMQWLCTENARKEKKPVKKDGLWARLFSSKK